MLKTLHIFDVSPFLHAGHVNKASFLEKLVDAGSTWKTLRTCTGGLSLLMNSLASCNHFDDFVFACDRNPTIKKGLDPAYKANRSPKDWMGVEKGAAEYILDKCNATVLAYPGYEADDIIYTIVRKCYDAYDRIFVYTGDSDLYFLVDDKVSIKPSSSKAKTVTRENFEREASKEGFRYNCITMNKIIKGDSSDNISALPKALQNEVATFFYRDVFFDKLGDLDFVRSWIEMRFPEVKPQIDLIFPMIIEEVPTSFKPIDWNMIKNFGDAINNRYYRGHASQDFDINPYIDELHSRGIYLEE